MRLTALALLVFAANAAIRHERKFFGEPLTGIDVAQPQIKTRWLVGARQGHRASVKDAINKIGGRIHREFSLTDAFAVFMDENLLDELRSHIGVDYVEEDRIRRPMAEVEPWGVAAVNATAVWSAPKAPTRGNRTIVCVIDGGLFYNHEDLSGIDVVNTNPYTEWNFTGCNHGSHVSGTIGAVTGNGIGVSSVAPGASQYIVRVFQYDTCNWTFSSGLIAAAEECHTASANIISMSLGGGGFSSTENSTFSQLLNTYNILPVAAAGNDGTTGFSYPASYDSVMSVAAVNESLGVASFSQKNSQVDIAAPGVGVLSTIAKTTSVNIIGFNSSTSRRLPAMAMEYTVFTNVSGSILKMNNYCNPANGDWNGVDATGKIVLCYAGNVYFSDQVRGAQHAGAVGIMIMISNDNLFAGYIGSNYSIPAVIIGYSSGTFLENLAGAKGVMDLRDHLPPTSDYAAWDGTSMATPHVSGVAALLWSANPNAGAHAIRNCIQSTALDLGPKGRDDSYGFGFVQARKAHDCITATNGMPTTSPVTSSPTGSSLSPTSSPTVPPTTSSLSPTSSPTHSGNAGASTTGSPPLHMNTTSGNSGHHNSHAGIISVRPLFGMLFCLLAFAW
jgi:subtilisin family serine protease